MSKEGLLETIYTGVSNMALQFEEHSPEIGFWCGLGLMLGGAGLAIYESVKRVPEIKKEAEIKKKDIKVNYDVGLIDDDTYAEQMKDATRHEVVSYVKTYILPGVMILVGGCAQVAAHIEANHRFIDVCSTAALDAAAFNEYRKRTAALIGEEQEKALYYGKELVQETKEIKDEDGNVVGTATEYTLVENENTADVPFRPYVYEFSRDTSAFAEQYADLDDYIDAFLETTQNTWDGVLKRSSKVFLVDILNALGLHTEENNASRVTGWLNPKYYKEAGDGYIDFRVTKIKGTMSDGREGTKWMLDFNCDGNIIEPSVRQEGWMGKSNLYIGETK